MKNKNDRRDFLKAAGATLVAASVPTIAAAQHNDEKDVASTNQYPIYLNGCGWNRELPGILGRACFVFEARGNVNGTGFGTIRDDVYSEVNSQFAISSVRRHGRTYTLLGQITDSQTPAMVGMRVRIDAESTGAGTGRAALTIQSDGDDLVVIAIIAVLMALLLPAVQ
jgi:hypothetical protein